MSPKVSRAEKQELLNEYAGASRAFADAVERLRDLNKGVAAFIHALEEVGTAHRTCERSRVRLEKYLSQRRLPS